MDPISYIAAAGPKADYQAMNMVADNLADLGKPIDAVRLFHQSNVL